MSVMNALAELAKGREADEAAGGTFVPKSWFVNPNDMLDSMGIGYQYPPSTVTYETLRTMAARNSIIASIIQTRLNQVASFCQPQRNEYSVGFDFRHRERHHKLTASDKDLLKKLRYFILNTGMEYNVDRDDFEAFTRSVMRDRMTFDQLTFEKIPRWDGLPHSFHGVDASTIRLRRRPTIKAGPISPEDHDDAVRYVQLMDGVVVTEYTTKELAFGVSNPRTDIRVHGYGMSELELLITTVTYHLFAEQWNQRVFSQGSTIKGIINLSGNVPQRQLDDFKRQWITQVSGVSNAWRTPLTNVENLQWIPLQPSNNDMGYQQWLEYLIKVACAVYQIDPTEINFDLRGSVGQQPAFMSANEAQQKISKDKGLQPLVRSYFNLLNKQLIWPYNDQWELIPAGLDSKTEEQAIELRQKSLGSHRTLNEVREEEGRPPQEDGDVVLNPVYIQWRQQKDAQRAQEKMAAQQQLGAPAGAAPAPGGKPPPTQTPAMQVASQQKQMEEKLGQNPDLGTESAQAGEALERAAADGADEKQFNGDRFQLRRR